MINSKSGQSGADKQGALKEAIADYYQRQYQAALDLRKQLNVNIPIIAGHLTTIASVSDSVREIYRHIRSSATLFLHLTISPLVIFIAHSASINRVIFKVVFTYSIKFWWKCTTEKCVCLIDFEQDKLAKWHYYHPWVSAITHSFRLVKKLPHNSKS